MEKHGNPEMASVMHGDDAPADDQLRLPPPMTSGTPLPRAEDILATIGSGGYRLRGNELTALGLASPTPRPPSFGLYRAESLPASRVGPGASDAEQVRQLAYVEGQRTDPPASGTRQAPGGDSDVKLQEESGTTPRPREHGDVRLEGLHLQPTEVSTTTSASDRKESDHILRLLQQRHEQETGMMLMRMRQLEAQLCAASVQQHSLPIPMDLKTGNVQAGSENQGGYRHSSGRDQLGLPAGLGRSQGLALPGHGQEAR